MLLCGLQLAGNNARGLHTEPYVPNTVRTTESYPEGLDLAEPGAVYQITDDPEAKLIWERFEHDHEDEQHDEE